MLNSRCLTEKYTAVGIMFLTFILFFVFDVKSQAEPNNTADIEPNEITQPQAEAAEAFENKMIDIIEVQGNIYISSEKILAVTRSRESQLFTIAQAQEDVKRIATVTGVEFAYYSTLPADGKVKLIFVIKEKSVIRQIDFTGDDKTPERKLLEKLGFNRGDYLDRLTAQTGVEKLVEYYHTSGYPFVQVNFDDSGLQQGNLHYIIDKGQRVKIKKTKFEGNKAIKRRELLKAIKGKPKNLFLFQNYFKQSTLDDDLVELQQAYDRRGYLDTKVSVKTNLAKNKKNVEIVYSIVEGKQYNVEKIEFSGNKFISDANLTSTFRLKKGQFYSNDKAEYDRDEILRDYRQVGFIYVQVQSSRKFVSDDKVIAIFDVNEGERFRIGQINISGNRGVQDKVIRRILDESNFKPGEWYDAHIARGTGEGELEKDIKGSVYTETTTITPVGDKPGQKDAEVRVKEGKTGSIIFGAGVSSTDGLIGQVVYEQRNFDVKKWPKNWRKFFSQDAFKGAGQQFKISLEPGTEVSRYAVSFTEPFLKDKPIAMTIAGSSWARGRESYDEQRKKGFLGFTRRMKKGWYRTLAFRAENVTVENLDTDAPKEVTDIEGDNLLGGVRIGFGRDTTDSRFMPTKGKNFDLGYEQVVGDSTFGVVDGTYRWYKTLREDIARRKTVLETKFYAGAIVGDAPLFEKFYGGGLGSIRGFDYRGVSPRSGVDDDPVGSNWIVTGSGEISVPLYSETLAGLLFVDTGMVETGGIRAAAGIGIQIMIPQWFGPVPMRFELATPFMKSDEDKTQFFSFSAGALF